MVRALLVHLLGDSGRDVGLVVKLQAQTMILRRKVEIGASLKVLGVVFVHLVRQAAQYVFAVLEYAWTLLGLVVRAAPERSHRGHLPEIAHRRQGR